MDIREAKQQIKNAMTAYFSKDEFGNYLIPIEKQRPVFLYGAPGIGKTAIIQQIAEELKVGLVSYSMTHHTRQSALGLPYITKKSYGGREYSVSEYTMSEIVASVYDMMEQTGVGEGILFLDEINCVSETLAPAMLQFLQYKIFGRHRIPDGWIVVTAGNPPEFNRSVREFDIATLDRLKRIDVEPDYDAWKEYAYAKGVHASITTYLSIRKDNFYKVETTVGGKSFVTARGWDDLSDMIKLYEKNGIVVDGDLIFQYLQNKRIAGDFALYYDLYNKYKSDYRVDEILSGRAPEDLVERARAAAFDERLALLGLLLDAAVSEIRSVIEEEQTVSRLLAVLKSVKRELEDPACAPEALLGGHIGKLRAALESRKKSCSLSQDAQVEELRLIAALDGLREHAAAEGALKGEASFALMKADFDGRVARLRERAGRAGKTLSNLFAFCEKAFGEGNEMMILVTELTASKWFSKFIARHGCKEYFEHNKELLLYDRRREIMEQLGDYT